MKYNDLTLLIPGIVIQLFIYKTNKCTTNKHNLKFIGPSIILIVE